MKIYKIAQSNFEFPNFDVDKYLRTEEDAVGLLVGSLMIDPNSVPLFLGMSKREIFNNFQNKVKEKIHPSEVHLFLEKFKNYDDIVDAIRRAVSTMPNPTFSHVRDMVFLMLGLEDNIVERMRQYVPLVIKGTSDIEDVFEETGKGDKKKAIDSILDRYNMGEISKEKMNEMIREFAKIKSKFLKTS